MKMKRLIAYPDYRFERITDITADDLRKMNASAVALDLDNTTVKDASYHLSHKVREWIDSIKAEGFKVIIVSNTYPVRALYLAEKMGGVPYISFARKPHTKALRKAAEKLEVPVERIAMIGDRLFTDIAAANKSGAISIKVEPMGNEKFFTTHYIHERKREEEYLSNFRKTAKISKKLSRDFT